MILKGTFTKENLDRIRKTRKVNPPVLERAIFALGLLEALSKVGCEFIFKGGSSLMLLLDKPMRLSTDCDILVKPDYNIEFYIEKASKIYPFISFEESIRKTSKNIAKKHFRFSYNSIIKNGEVTILLDVLFAETPYSEICEKKIVNDFLITDGNDLSVRIPTVNAILGDKLTAFAPHTIGINYYNSNFSNDKRLEVIKQFYDCATLFDYASDFNKIRDNYISVAKEEIKYRNLDITYIDSLYDTFNCLLSIASRGFINQSEYENLLNGMRKVKDHIYGEVFTAETAINHSAKVMLLVAGIIKNVDILNIKINNHENIKDTKYKKLNYLNNSRTKDAFNMIAEALEILES